MKFKPSESPRALFRVLLVLVVVVLVSGTYLTLRATGSLMSRTETASERAQLAQLAAESSDHLRAMNQIIDRRLDAALNSDEVTRLTETQREAVVA